jgi:hypothetical protein
MFDDDLSLSMSTMSSVHGASILRADRR